MAEPIPLIARVECRSDGAAEERPVAVWLGGRRVEVEHILSDGVAGPAVAGGNTERRVVLRLENGDVLRLVRVLPAGDWRVYRRGQAKRGE